MLPLEIFWILTPQNFLFWASESFRQDIGKFHSPWMKPSGCKENQFHSLPFGQSEASIY